MRNLGCALSRYVATTRKQLQVLDSIVRSVPILVVHRFGRQKLSPEVSLHHIAVLKHPIAAVAISVPAL